MPYEFVRVDSQIVKVRPVGEITPADNRELKAFLRTVRDDLLFDLTALPAAQISRVMLTVRPMLPRTACFGPELPECVRRGLPGKDYYMHDVRHFGSEQEALAWLP